MTAQPAPPPGWLRTLLLSGAMLLVLIGAGVLLSGRSAKLGMILVGIGCAEFFTVFRLFRGR